MSREALWAKIQEVKDVGQTKAQTFHDETVSLIKTMDEGIPLPVALKIINGIWGNSSYQSKDMKTRLSGLFPKINSDVIQWAPLPEEELKKCYGDLVETRQYFDLIHAYIEAYVCEVLKFLVKSEFTTAQMDLLNDFRREVLRYTAFVGDFFYEVCDALEKSDVKCWKDLTFTPDCVENGDYLFVTDFKEDLLKVHEEYRKKAFAREDGNGSMKSFDWKTRNLGINIKLPFLFAEWLNDRYPHIGLSAPASE